MSCFIFLSIIEDFLTILYLLEVSKKKKKDNRFLSKGNRLEHIKLLIAYQF